MALVEKQPVVSQVKYPTTVFIVTRESDHESIQQVGHKLNYIKRSDGVWSKEDSQLIELHCEHPYLPSLATLVTLLTHGQYVSGVVVVDSFVWVEK